MCFLQGLGVQLGNGGAVKVDEYSRTNIPSIYAIGDVTGRLDLTPVAIMEAMAFSATVFGGVPTKPIHENVSPPLYNSPIWLLRSSARGKYTE